MAFILYHPESAFGDSNQEASTVAKFRIQTLVRSFISNPLYGGRYFSVCLLEEFCDHSKQEEYSYIHCPVKNKSVQTNIAEKLYKIIINQQHRKNNNFDGIQNRGLRNVREKFLVSMLPCDFIYLGHQNRNAPPWRTMAMIFGRPVA